MQESSTSIHPLSNTTQTMKCAVVIATIRENSLKRFLEEWVDEFTSQQVRLIIIEDNPEKQFSIGDSFPFPVSHYAWDAIEGELGEAAWIMPRRTSAIKSFGFLKAYQGGSDMIVALDDDCYPVHTRLVEYHDTPFIATHRANLFSAARQEACWTPSIRSIRPRGLPYEQKSRNIQPECVWLSHGLWANIPDLDGKTQLSMKTFPPVSDYFTEQVIPVNTYFPMCGMNIAFKRALTPAMYFMLMGRNRREESWGYDRFDDIWAGIVAKKIMDHLGYRAYSGHPVIWHDRASNAETNIQKEASGMIANEYFFLAVDGIKLTKSTVSGCYRQIAEQLPLSGNYWDDLKRAMAVWADLFT